jgi:hypothetical protein
LYEELTMAKEGRGFAGFDSLVTDLSDLPSPPTPPAPEAKPAARPAAAADDDNRPVRYSPPKPKEKRYGKWIVIAAVVSGMIIYGVIDSNSKRSSYSQATYTPPARATPPATVAPPAAPQTSAAASEDKPPSVEGTVLSSAQLRYCLAQGVRIDGANKATNAASQIDIDRFNALVADYNARCPKARYRESIMSTVKADVEARRTQLEREGAALIRSPYSR